jgi:hypothetical protein
MLVPVLPHHPYMLPVHTPSNEKPAPHIYYQQHTLQIIQLVEGQPPPPRRMGSIAPSDSSASSSSSSSEFDSESDSDDESIQSSYCSSDDRPMHQPWSEQPPPYPFSIPDDTYSYRMKRVFAWRDNSSSDSDTSSSSYGNTAHHFPMQSQSNSTFCIDLPRSSASIRRLVGDAMEDDAVCRFALNPSFCILDCSFWSRS